MNSWLVIALTAFISLLLWVVIAPILMYYTYKFWQCKMNDEGLKPMKPYHILSALLSITMIINSIFTLPFLTLIYFYYYQQYDSNETLYASLYPLMTCLYGAISLEPLLYNLRLFAIYARWRLNVDVLALKLNHSPVFDARSHSPFDIKTTRKTKKNSDSATEYIENDGETRCKSQSFSLPWSIRSQFVFSNIKTSVCVIILAWFGLNLVLSLYPILHVILLLFTLILTLLLVQFNDTLGVKRELLSITVLLVGGLLCYSLLIALTHSQSFDRMFCGFVLMEMMQILIVIRIICGKLPWVDAVVSPWSATRGFALGGSFIGDTIHLEHVLDDDDGYRYFAEYLVCELNVSQLFYLSHFIDLQQYIVDNEWIKHEFITCNMTENCCKRDDQNQDHNTVGQCLHDMHYMYRRYLADNCIANIHMDPQNIELLIDEFVQNKDLNNKNELQILKALYVEYEAIAIQIYTRLAEQSINRFMLSSQYKNWKSSSYKTFKY